MVGGGMDMVPWAPMKLGPLLEEILATPLIVTFWLQCHISIFIAIIKLKTFYRWSEVRFAGFELRRFRNVRHHCLVSENSTPKKIFAT